MFCQVSERMDEATDLNRDIDKWKYEIFTLKEKIQNIVKPQSKVQTSVLGQGVDFVFPLSQQQEQEQEKQPPPKSSRRGCTRRLKSDIYTTHRLLAELRGLGVQMTKFCTSGT